MFKRTLPRYGTTPEPVTPYQKAAQLWDERIGSARIQARNWRLMAFGSIGLAMGLAGIVAWQSGQSRIIPYVVEVNRLGEARAVAPAATAYQPTDAQVAYYLGRFIGNVRSLSTDPVLVRQNWLAAYEVVADRAALFLNEQAKLDDPFSRIGTNSVTVQVTSIVRASDLSNGPNSISSAAAWSAPTAGPRSWRSVCGPLARRKPWPATPWASPSPPLTGRGSSMPNHPRGTRHDQADPAGPDGRDTLRLRGPTQKATRDSL